MPMDFRPPTPLEHFACLVRQDSSLPLLEAAVCLGQQVQADLDVQAVLCQVDAWAQRLRQQLPWGASPLQRAQLLNMFFYERLGFAANANDYGHADNSYLHRVVQTRRGLPITLAVLWMELATAIGLKVEGVSFPGHFLVKLHVPEGLIIQDPLTGQGLTSQTLGEWLEPHRESWGLSEDEMAPLHLFLQPASASEIVERMLRNLRAVYQRDADAVQELQVLHRLLQLQPSSWELYRDRGMLRAQAGEREAALEDLQTYARNASAPHDLLLVEAHIEGLRAGV